MSMHETVLCTKLSMIEVDDGFPSLVKKFESSFYMEKLDADDIHLIVISIAPFLPYPTIDQ
jgi:hypothetical protein